MKFRKKPVVIEAVQWTGLNYEALMVWARGSGIHWSGTEQTLTVPTLEGPLIATVNDWIIRGVKGEFYPCKPDIFAATYEPVE
jgi:hypothetical protein